jgi:hypothetical protein
LAPFPEGIATTSRSIGIKHALAGPGETAAKASKLAAHPRTMAIRNKVRAPSGAYRIFD